MASSERVDNLTDTLKGLVISASGNIPGYQHDEIKQMVEKCGAKFATMNLKECTHLVTTESNVKRNFSKITMAREQKGCQVVDMDWLLKSIEKKTPESVQKYLLVKKKGKKDTEAKTKKRMRETLPEDEANDPKKTKNEQQIIHKYLADLVDERYPNPRDKLAVWQDDDGLIWDATLIKVGSSASQVTLMIKRIQLLHCDESQKSHIWELNSHIGSTEETKWVGDLHSLQIGKVAFEEKLKSYSGHSWKDRDADPIDSFWIYLEIKHRESLILTGEIGELPSSVKKVLEFIFKSRNLDAYTQAMKSTGRSILHDKTVEKRKLVIGIAVLSRLMTLGKTPEPTPGTMSQAKQTLLWIYQWFYLQTSTSSITEKDVRHELESLDLLLKLHDAKEILKNQSQRSLALSQVSQALGLAKMLPVDQASTEFKMLHEYFTMTSSPHHAYRLERVDNVFRIERPGEAERFAQWEKSNPDIIRDRRLLWHGSDSGNFAGILSQGLRGDGVASVTGRGFRSGVYFADMSTKSAGYCVSEAGQALMLLCEVELGKGADTYLGSNVHKRWRDAGYIHPDFIGSTVPDIYAGTEMSLTPRQPKLYHSEYVVRDPAQIRQRYLFHIKLARSW